MGEGEFEILLATSWCEKQLVHSLNIALSCSLPIQLLCTLNNPCKVAVECNAHLLIFVADNL